MINAFNLQNNWLGSSGIAEIKSFPQIYPDSDFLKNLLYWSIVGLQCCVNVCCRCSVTQSCLTLCNPMDCNTPGTPALHYLPDFAQTHVHWVGDAIQPSHPLLPTCSSCPQSFPASESYSNELALCIRWPKDWSFSFIISPSNDYSGLIFLRIDWFDLLAVCSVHQSDSPSWLPSVPFSCLSKV